MRAGATLHRFHGRSISWALSTGKTVSTEIALLVTASGDVVGVGDALFGAELSQTWRFTGR